MADPLLDILTDTGGMPSTSGGAEPDPVLEMVKRARKRQALVDAGFNPDVTLAGSLQDFGKQAAMQAALSAVPMAGPALSRAASAAPTLAKVLGGAGAVTASTSQAGQGADTNEAVSNLKMLLEQQSALRRQTEAASQRREIERKSGEGKRFQSADQELKALNDQLSALSAIITREQRRNSPEYAMEIEQEKSRLAAEAQKKRSETPTRELISDYTGYIPAVTGGLALLGGAALKGRALSNFNREMTDLSARSGAAVQRAQSATSAPAYTAARKEAQSLSQELASRKAAGDPGTKQALEFGAGTGVVGAFLPEEVDFARAVAGSPLWGKLKETLIDDYPSTIKRAALAGGLGAGVGHLGALGVTPFMSRPSPPNYSAAAAALPTKRLPNVPGGGGPQLPPGPGQPPAIGGAQPGPGPMPPAPPPAPPQLRALVSPEDAARREAERLFKPNSPRPADLPKDLDWNELAGRAQYPKGHPKAGKFVPLRGANGKTSDASDALVDALMNS